MRTNLTFVYLSSESLPFLLRVWGVRNEGLVLRWSCVVLCGGSLKWDFFFFFLVTDSSKVCQQQYGTKIFTAANYKDYKNNYGGYLL